MLFASLDAAAYLAAALTQSQQNIAFTVGVLCMLLALYLRWRLPHESMTVEEYAKERRLTERQARQRVKIVRFGGPLAVALGLAAFAMIFWE